MKHLLLISIFLSICLCVSAQNTYEVGYFIDNNNDRVECLILNKDWKSTPREFNYKLTANSKVEKGEIKNVAEFGILNNCLYRRFNVKIDKSPEKVFELREEVEPNYEEETLFLRMLVEGNATLYYYEENDLVKMFFTTKEDHASPTQLLYKKYKNKLNNRIKANETYKSQLWEHLKCDDISLAKTTELEYNLKEIKNFFVDYNNCVGEGFTTYVKKSKWALSMASKAGIKVSEARLSAVGSTISNFDNHLGYSLGLEIEFIAPFNNRKWSILFNPAVHFLGNKMSSEDRSGRTTELKYNSLEMPVGFRYYMYLNNNNRLFLNAVAIYDIPFNSEILINNFSTFRITNSISSAFGFGVEWNKRIQIELRFMPIRNIINELTADLHYRYLSLNVGYRLF